MPSELSEMLHRFLEIYQREPLALRVLLDSPPWCDTTDIPPVEQLSLIKKGEELNQERLKRRATTITKSQSLRQPLLQEELGDSRQSHISNTEKLREMLQNRGDESPRGDEEYLADAKQHLASENSAIELLYLVADRIDNAATVYDQLLRDDTDFYELLPTQAHVLFRECHMNVALGYGATASILCGAVLEGALKDKVGPIPPDDGRHASLSRYIKRACELEYLKEQSEKMAWEILKYRNNAVHERQNVPPKDAYRLLGETRKLVGFLYSGSNAKGLD